MTKIDIETVRAMKGAGMELVANVVGPEGNVTFILTPEDVADFVADPEACYAKKHGGTRQDFEDWVGSYGMARCAAQTTKGKPCGSMVPGGSLDFETWLKTDREELCGTHAAG